MTTTNVTKGMTGAELLEKLPPEYQAKPLRVQHGKRTKVVYADDGNTPPTFRHNSRSWPLDGTLLWDLASFAGLSAATVKNLSPKTVGLAMTELLAAKGEYAIVLSPKTDKPTAFLDTTNIPTVPPDRLVRLIEQRLGGEGVSFHRALTLPNMALQIEAAGIDEHTVTRGDLVRAGVAVQFSPMGSIAPVVTGFTSRLVCTNGAVSTDTMSRFTGKSGGGNGRGNGEGRNGHGGSGEGDNVWQWFRQSIMAAYRSIAPIVDQYRLLAGENIDPVDRALVIENMVKEASLRPEDAATLRQMALLNPPETRWDAFNLLTALTSHRMTDPRRIVRAQRAHAVFADPTHHAYCSRCGRGEAPAGHPNPADTVIVASRN